MIQRRNNCRGIVITITERRFNQLITHFRRRLNFPQRIVPHRFRVLPSNIADGTRLYIISRSELRGFCLISRINRSTCLVHLENWIQYTPPVLIRGFGGYHDFRYCSYLRRYRFNNQTEFINENLIDFSNTFFLPDCLQ